MSIEKLQQKKELEKLEKHENDISDNEKNEETDDSRETLKEKKLKEQYSRLSEDQKSKFLPAQEEAIINIREYIKGEKELEDLLPEEYFVLQKLRTSYENFIKENPDKDVKFKFSEDINKRIYDNLIQKLSFKNLESHQRDNDQKKN